MPDNLTVALRLTADGSQLVGELKLSRRELERLGATAERAGGRAGLTRRLWSAFGREMEETRRRATGLRLAMAALATGVGARVGASFLEAASDAEELNSQFEAVFRNLTGEARDWADAHARLVGRSTLDIQQYMATLQDTFVPLGFAREQAFEFSRILTQLGVDLASFKNAAEPETIDLLTSAIVGNHEAVRRFGVVITESTLKQELLSAGIKGGTLAATEQQKVMARLRIILRSTADAQGDAARTADQHANQVRALTGDWRDFQVLFGRSLIPSAQTGIELLRKLLREFSEGLDPDEIGRELERRFRGVLLGAAAAADTLAKPLEIAGDAVEHLVDGFNRLPPWVQEIGILGAVLFGRKGRAALLAVSGIATIVEELTPGEADRIEELERRRASRLRTLRDAERAAQHASNDALRASHEAAVKLARERVAVVERELEMLRSANRLNADIEASARAHGATGPIVLPADTTLPAGLFGGSLIGGSGPGLRAELEAYFRRLDERNAGRTPAAGGSLPIPDIPAGGGVDPKAVARQEKEIASFVRKMRDALEEVQEDHRDAIAAILDAEADLAGPYERAVRAAGEWRRETLAGLDESAKGYEDYAARVEAVYVERIAAAAREAADRQLEESTRWQDGAVRGLRSYVEEARDAAAGFEGAFGSAARNTEDAFTRLATTGKVRINDLVNSIIADFARIQIRRNITGPIFSALAGWLAGGIGPNAPVTVGGVDLFHGGGTAGQLGGRRRSGVDPRAFIGAPRYHRGGIAGDEVPAILRRGERIFTPEQMRGTGGLRGVEYVEIRNEGAPKRISGAEFDWRRGVLSVVTQDIAAGGDTAAAMRARFPGLREGPV